MPIYEPLHIIAPLPNTTYVHPAEPAKILHPDDPATFAMHDFRGTKAFSIDKDAPIDTAFQEMEANDIHLLLVTNGHDNVAGVISTDDILGAKPIKLIQERRLARSNVLVHMIMTPMQGLLLFDIRDIEATRVGNVFTTLVQQKRPYAAAVQVTEGDGGHTICGLFSTLQIKKRLHIASNMSLTPAETLAELQKRKG